MADISLTYKDFVRYKTSYSCHAVAFGMLSSIFNLLYLYVWTLESSYGADIVTIG